MTDRRSLSPEEAAQAVLFKRYQDLTVEQLKDFARGARGQVQTQRMLEMEQIRRQLPNKMRVCLAARYKSLRACVEDELHGRGNAIGRAQIERLSIWSPSMD